MRKTIIISAILIFGCFLVASNAVALTLPAGSGSNEPTLQEIFDTNISGGTLDAVSDQSDVEAWQKDEGKVDGYVVSMFKGHGGTLGVYSTTTGAMYDLINPNMAVIDTVSFNINDAGALWIDSTEIDTAFGDYFGFYWVDTTQNPDFYSYTQDFKNTAGYGTDDNIQALTYLVPEGYSVYTQADGGTTVAALGNNDWILAFEDLPGPDGDGDFNDAVFYVEDMAPTPEPATVLMFGLGVLGMGIVSRKKLMA